MVRFSGLFALELLQSCVVLTRSSQCFASLATKVNSIRFQQYPAVKTILFTGSLKCQNRVFAC